MMVSPQDYDREERGSSSWWSSRHPAARKGTDTVKRARRVTLIDLLLLVIMAGVLVPFIMTQAGKTVLGPYQVSVRVKNRENERRLVLRVHLPGNEVLLSESPVGWKIFDTQGKLIHEEWDISPNPGDAKEFLYISDAHLALRCEIAAGGQVSTRLF